MRTKPLATIPLLLLAAASVLAFSSCPGKGRARGNLVLVTVESLRADRLAGPAPERDPFRNLRALAGADGIRAVLAPSSESLPALASLLTGESPARHGTLVEGLDRLPAGLPTLGELLSAAGYRTAGFPSMASLGLSSGLSRGFQAYGWPPLDAVGGAPLASTNREGWVANGVRRPGQATVADAMNWVRQHRAEPIFLWIHLAEATPPYATDRDLAALYPGSTYDASMAYEDRCVKALVDGFTSLGLQDRTTFVVTGNHGESLGDHGESFHGLNLYPPSLATAVAVIRPAGAAGKPAAAPQAAPARLQDLYAAILSIAGVEAPAGSGAKAGMPAVSAAEPLLAVTAGPRSSFGWSGRVALYDGGHAWFGPQDEEYYEVRPALALSGDLAASDPAGARLLREKALALAAPIASRLAGRPAVPSAETRARLLELLHQAGASRERQDVAGERAAIGQAWLLDPGNFEVAKWLVQASGTEGKGTNPGIVSVVADRGTGMPEADLAIAQILQGTRGLGDPLEARARACARSGAGCAVELALLRARASQVEPAAAGLAPVAEQEKDADLWRTLGDLYLAAQNTYRASQAFEKAAGLRPNDPDILLRQGDCLAATRDYKGASAKYEAAGAAQPGLALADLRLGRLSLQMRDRAAALEHFRKGVGVDTNTSAGAVALGRLLSDEGMTQEAIPLFLDAASRDTSSVEPLYYAAEALAAEGNLEEAEKQMRRALDRDPKNAPVLYQLARLVVYRGRREEGGQLLERLAQVAPPEIAVAALKDQLFVNDAPGQPLAKGLEALYEAVRKATPEGGVLTLGAVPGEAPAAPPAPKP